eukprot:gene7546-2733_t
MSHIPDDWDIAALEAAVSKSTVDKKHIQSLNALCAADTSTDQFSTDPRLQTGRESILRRLFTTE